MRWPIRLARTIALAVIIAIGINHVFWAVTDWHLKDAGAYWEAAMRLRDGQQLFPPVANVEASEVYRYSPWFAWLWVPLTYLPRALVGIAWSAVLLGASALAILPLWRRGAWVAVAFFLPILIGISATGNVHPLLIAVLVLGVERRSGPAWIAVAASLKAVPILFVLTYLGRRQWERAGITIVATAILVAPMLLYDLSNYVTTAGGAPLLIAWPPGYVAAVGIGIVVSLRLADGRWGWLTSATTVSLALPRFFLYDVTYLMVGAPAEPPATRATSRSARSIE
ncbi:MAG: glycosyltransferase family 87 protein [Candidatus Limnocylindria bacterium]